MTVTIRSMIQEDVEKCAHICFESFKGIADKHNFRWDFVDPEQAIQLMQSMFLSPNVFNVVAESDGKLIGSNHLTEYNEILAVGPITVDPTVQAKGVGRMLMKAVIDRGEDARGIRLVQDAFNTASLSLYASLGFDVREPLVLIEGVLKSELPDATEVRQMQESDFDACAELCRATIGFDRNNELRATPPFLPSFVAIREGKVRAYASAPHFWALNHAVAETDGDMQSLLTGACTLGNQAPLSLLLPTRQARLFRWLLREGMRVIKPLTLMSMRDYQDPKQVYLPSVGY